MKHHIGRIVVGVVLAAGLAATSVLFASSDGTVAVAEDAAVQIRAQELLGAMTVVRASLSEALLIDLVRDQGLVEGETVVPSLTDARSALAELESQAASYSVLLTVSASSTQQAIAEFVASAKVLMHSLDSASAAGLGPIQVSRFTTAYDGLSGILVAERDSRELHIASVRGGVARTADAARFVVAFLIPGLAILGILVVSDRRQRKAAIRSEVEQEIHLRKAKDEFLTAVAHELRTPLTAVVGFAETLRDSESALDPIERDELLGILADEADDTAALVEDLLVFARTNVGDLAIRAEVVSVRELVERVAYRWSGRHRSRLTVSGHGAVWADPLRLRQVMRDLLSNAFVHGGEHVEVRILQGDKHLTIEVADNGAGIPRGLEGRAFDAYSHGPSEPGGPASIGLGLTVARSLVRLMDGEINYSHRDNKSVFEVVLPAASQAGDGAARTDTVVDMASRLPSAAQLIEVLEGDAFKVVYQPIVDIQHPSSELRTVGYEALSRFATGSPPEWFAAASMAGLRTDLELAAIRKAVAGFAAAAPGQFLALNVSLETVLAPQLVDALEGIAPNRVVLELHEDTIIDNYDRTKVHIDRLTNKGYRLAVDDLAKGHIDLWQLVRLRPTVVKFDISMIRDIDLDSSKRSLVNGLTWLGEVLKAQVVAEGIERREELDRLKRLGVHFGQGFLLGKPGPLVTTTPSLEADEIPKEPPVRHVKSGGRSSLLPR